MAEGTPAAGTAQGDSEVREKAARQLMSQLLAPHGQGDPAVCEDRRCLAHCGIPPGMASPCAPWMRHPGAPRAHEDTHAVRAAHVASDPANCPGSCCHQQGRQGWLCTPGLEISLGTREGWSRYSRALAWVVSLSQGAGCQGRFGTLARAVDACFGACRGLLQVPIGDASLQGCFIAETLPPSSDIPPQSRVPALPKGSWRRRALPSTKTNCRAALGRGSKLSW